MARLGRGRVKRITQQRLSQAYVLADRTGSTTPTGAVSAKAVTQATKTGSITPGGATTLASVKSTLVGSSTPAGSIAGKQLNKPGAGSTTPTGALGTLLVVRILADRTGSITPTGSVTPRVITKNLTGSITPTGAISKAITQGTKAGSTTPTGAISKAITQGTKAGSTTPTGTIDTSTPTIITKNTAGSITPTGTAAPKSITKALTGSTTPVGTVSTFAFKLLSTRTATSTPAGSIAGKQVIKPKAGSTTPSGLTGPKSVAYLLTSTLAPSGSMTPIKLSATGTWAAPAKALPDEPVIWSQVLWDAEVPDGASLVIKTSLNNGATWQEATNGGPIPLLAPESKVAKAVLVKAEFAKQSGVSLGPVLNRLSVDIDTNTSRTEVVPCGVFVITDTTVTDGPGGLEIQLDGLDLSLLVQENSWEGVKTFASGTNLGLVIKQIIQDRYPAAKFKFSDTAMVAPAMLTVGASAGNNPLSDAQRIAQFCGMELFVDYAGYFVLQNQPDPSIDPVVYTFSDRAKPTMTKVMRRLSRAESFNVVVVSGETSGTAAPVSATVADNDPLSPSYYLGKGGKRVKRVVSKLVKSVGDAMTMAQALLLKLKGAGETIEISAVPNPALEEGDTVAVERTKAGLNANYLLDAFEINFSVTGDMTFAGRRQKLDQSQASGGSVGGLDGDTSGSGGGSGGGTVLRTYTTPGQCHKIGTNGNLNHYKLQTAFSGAGSITERSQSQIGGGYSVNPEYCMTADKTAVNMRVNLNAPTTSGSNNPRTEYREMDANGTSTNGWNPSSGLHYTQCAFRFTHLAAVKKSCSAMQIHDTADDVLQVLTALVGGVLKIGYKKNGGSFTTIANYTVGSWVTVAIGVDNGTMKIWYKTGIDPDMSAVSPISLGSISHSGNCYFKIGTYSQSTSDESGSDYAQGEYKKIGLYHPGYPTPVYDTDFIGTPTTPSSFTLAFGACINTTGDVNTLTHIKNAGPDYFAILGDTWYKDGQSANWVADWNTRFGQTKFAQLISALPNPIIVGLSDHDFGYNNNAVGNNGALAASFNAAYRTKFGSSGAAVQGATLPANGYYRTWVVGRVRFVLLDMLTFKSPLGSANSSSRSMLGATQKTWYKNIIRTATEPLLVVLGDGQIPGPAEDGQDEWRGYAAERLELGYVLLERYNTGKHTIYLNGDTHSLAYGTGQWGYSKVFQSAPLHNTTKVKAGGEGYENTYPTNKGESDVVVSELYSIVTFTDNGTQMSITYRGYEGTTVRLTNGFSFTTT